jgi:hypothetical protein
MGKALVVLTSLLLGNARISIAPRHDRDDLPVFYRDRKDDEKIPLPYKGKGN